MRQKNKILILSLGILAFNTGCSKEVINKVPTSDEPLSITINNSYPAYPIIISNGPHRGTPNVCNPFPGGSDAVVQEWNGIKAKIRYLPTGSPATVTDLNSFLTASTAIDANIYLSDLNVPTTFFTRGFEQADGTPLKDPNGNILNEGFSLQMDTKIRLAPWEKPGLRQFAIISDDGAIMQINQGSGLTNFLNNDGLHSSKMACATSAIWLGQQQDLPIHIDYFQGPRTQIALMLLWRHIPDQYGTGEKDSPILSTSSLQDSACGQTGNDTFFISSSNPSSPIPTALWDQIRKNGWEVVPAIDFVLPGKSPVNPCYDRSNY